MGSTLQESVVRVISAKPDNQHFGTAFVIHREGKTTYLLTCAHVVRDVGGRDCVYLGDMPATVVASGGEGGPDLAVLKVTGLSDKPVLKLRTIGAKGRPFITTGFQLLDNSKHLLRDLEGTLGGQIGIEPRTQGTRFRAWDLAIEGDYILRPGYSGAPLTDKQSHHILGVVSHRQQAGRQGIAISVETLEVIWPGMPADLLSEPTPPVQPILPAKPRMNLNEELAAFEAIATGTDNHTRILLIDGPTGMGKTFLVSEYRRISAGAGLLTLSFSLGQQITIEECLYRIILPYGLDHFPSYGEFVTAGRPEPWTREMEATWHRTLNHKFLLDLSRYPDPPRLALFFDQYEKADRPFKDWLARIFVPGVQSVGSIILVVAGQESLPFDLTGTNMLHFALKGVSLECYRDCALNYGLVLEDKLLNGFHEILHGEPKRFVEHIEKLSAGDRGNL
jgi:trypsin-like peptidase